MNTTLADDVPVSSVFKIVFVGLWIIALVSNGLCSLLLWHEIKLQHCNCWANILLFTMAILDLLILSLVLLPSVLSLFIVDELLQTNNGLCYFQGITLNTLVLCLYFLALCISIDQYIAFCHPFMYNTQITRNTGRSKCVIFTFLPISFIGLLFHSLIPKTLGADLLPLEPPLLCYYNLQSDFVQNKVFSVINTCLMIGNSCVLLFCSLAVAYQFYKLNNAAHSSQTHVTVAVRPASVVNKQQMALAKLTLVIAILFLSCSIPFEVVCVLHLLSSHPVYTIDYFVINALMIGTVLNPFMYMLIRASVRKQLNKYLKLICSKSKTRKTNSKNRVKRMVQPQVTSTPNSVKINIPQEMSQYLTSIAVSNDIPAELNTKTSKEKGHVELIKVTPLHSED